MGKIINDEGCRVIIVNGVEDHVHCLFLLKSDIQLSRVLQRVKSLSSGWINQNNLTPQKFSWQSGYGAFSHSESSVENVIKYIERQEEHHSKRSFQKEYIELLERFNIDYEDKYVFQDLE
jgi:REP element-mobilizing transposase RayT